MRRSACLAVLAACLLGSATVTLEGRVKLEDNRLYVDGKPFFPYGCWGCIESVESMKQHHFNCVFSGMDGTADLLEEAAEEDFFVITYPYAPRWGMQHEEHILAVRDHPNLLAWNIGDDLKATDVEKVRHAYEYIRQHDPYHRPVMLDVIHGWEKYTWFEQMFCAYTYPLVKRPTLLEYQQFLRDRHAIVGADKFLWTWAQAHVQDWYTAMYLGPEASLPRSLYPDGTEMRLVVYSALAAGCRGTLYFPSPFFTEDFHGVDRYAEAALIGVELKVIGPWLAEGVVGKQLWTSEPTLHAWPVDFPGGTLVLLMHIDDETQYHVGAARAEGTVMLPGRLVGGEHVYELSLGDGAREVTSRVRDGKCGVGFDMTDLLLITDDQALAREADAKLERLLADSARYAAQAAGAKRRKVQRVLGALDRTHYPDAEALSASVRSAGALIHDANESIAQAEFAAAFRSARGADRVLREAVRDHWRHMNADPFVREMMVLPNFYLAEGYYPMVRAMTEAEPSGNLLPNGSFEHIEGERLPGWGDALIGQRRGVALPARSGQWALRLASDSPAIWEGEEHDWVTVDVISEPVQVRPWDALRAGVWVRVPEQMQQTSRGAVLQLLGLDEDGQRLQAATIGERSRLETTDGWERLAVRRILRRDDVVCVAVRLGICGVGQAWFDDVMLVRLRPEIAPAE